MDATIFLDVIGANAWRRDVGITIRQPVLQILVHEGKLVSGTHNIVIVMSHPAGIMEAQVQINLIARILLQEE